MNKSQRIYFDSETTDNKYINIRLEQGIETLELMSMELSTKDAYQNFNADYGVLVGRVTANGGVGVPNAKVSIFIPLMDEDANNSDIKLYYPYKTPRDKNLDDKRYNLLPRVSKIDPNDGTIRPKQAFGSFPIKEEILTNEKILNVYKKYYKYATTTNDAGDYMIFGVPTGTQIVHMSVDITDIGNYSMTPAGMVGLGYSPNLFTDNNSKIKESTDLDDLPNIETQDITVDVIPFWGDTENFEIGITRQDFRVRAELVNQFVVFGSAFTDGTDAMWGDNIESTSRRIGELFRAGDDANETVGMNSKRIGKITEKIYYYPAEVEQSTIDNVNPTSPDIMRVLDKTEYTAYKRDGDFVFIIPCNRDKVITDDFGNTVSVDDDSTIGVFTTFKGFITLEITAEEIPMDATEDIGNNTTVKQYRYKLKFPQYGDAGEFFDNDDGLTTTAWRKQHFTFEAQKFYSFARFHPMVSNHADSLDYTDGDQFPLTSNGFFAKDKVNNVIVPTPRNNDDPRDPFWNVGIIVTETHGTDPRYDDSDAGFPSNLYVWNSTDGFGANWINFTVYLPQLGYMSRGYSHIRDVRTADHFHKQKNNDNSYNKYYLTNNEQIIAGGEFNTKYFARNDLNWTDIIEVPLEDVTFFRSQSAKGFKYSSTQVSSNLKGLYRNGSRNSTLFGWSVTAPCPYNGGKLNAIPTGSNDTNTYFYKGYEGADCFQYLEELGLI